MANPYILYAMTHSLYSGRARSYLIKHQIPFQELSTGHESFKADVLPKGKLPTIPTLVTPEGEVIRDGAAIIEYFEAANGRPSRPDSRALSSASSAHFLTSLVRMVCCVQPCTIAGIFPRTIWPSFVTTSFTHSEIHPSEVRRPKP